YLVNQPIENLQTDNGSEFALEFERATTKLSISHRIENGFHRITDGDNKTG
ncbi:unnamed protein product, partial [marine sediment metagenome]